MSDNNGWKKIDLSKFQPSCNAGRNIFAVMLWRIFGQPLLKYLPTHVGHPKLWNKVRAGILRMFGAKVGSGAVIRCCRVYYPWKLELGDNVWIGYGVNLYNLAKITVGDNVVISQNAFLCTGSHDAGDPNFGLVTGEIVLKDAAWVCANCFVGPNVTFNEGAVAAAGSVVVKDMPALTISGGNPAKFIKNREIRE